MRVHLGNYLCYPTDPRAGLNCNALQSHEQGKNYSSAKPAMSEIDKGSEPGSPYQIAVTLQVHQSANDHLADTLGIDEDPLM